MFEIDMVKIIVVIVIIATLQYMDQDHIVYHLLFSDYLFWNILWHILPFDFRCYFVHYTLPIILFLQEEQTGSREVTQL